MKRTKSKWVRRCLGPETREKAVSPDNIGVKFTQMVTKTGEGNQTQDIQNITNITKGIY